MASYSFPGAGALYFVLAAPVIMLMKHFLSSACSVKRVQRLPEQESTTSSVKKVFTAVQGVALLSTRAQPSSTVDVVGLRSLMVRYLVVITAVPFRMLNRHHPMTVTSHPRRCRSPNRQEPHRACDRDHLQRMWRAFRPRFQRRRFPYAQ